MRAKGAALKGEGDVSNLGVSMKFKLMIVFCFVVITSCSNVTIYKGKVSPIPENQFDSIAKSIDRFFLDSGFVAEVPYENKCQYAHDETLCLLGINSSWKLWSKDRRSVFLWSGINIDAGNTMIRIVPQPYQNDKAIEIGEQLRDYLSNNLQGNEFELIKYEEIDILR
jgi:hypothetical protein